MPPAGGAGRPGPRTAFRLLRPVAAAACGYALATLVWLAFGDNLPGGRWFAVHLFTLGILSNLVVALTEHFAATLLRGVARHHQRQRFVLLNAGALLVLGFPPTLRYPLMVGATVLAGAVLSLAVDLHRWRRADPAARFAFVVRGYEHACAAFLVGAALGALLGTGVLTGAWYGAGRLAHLHVNILGWGGLTLLSTLVFFGPAMMRTRMELGADVRAGSALLLTPAGLCLAVAGLLATGGWPQASWPRMTAAAGLALYALGATVVASAVVRAGRRARAALHAWMIRAACVWFVVVVWADVAAIATARLRLLDTLGAALIVAVLGQAIMAALNYLTPMVWATGADRRSRARQRLEMFAPARVGVVNAGAVLVLLAGLAGTGAGTLGAVAARAGWALVAAAVITQITLMGIEANGALAAGRNPTTDRPTDGA